MSQVTDGWSELSGEGGFAPGVIEGAAWGMIGRTVVLHPIRPDLADYLCDAAMSGVMEWQWGSNPRSHQGFFESMWHGALDAFAIVDKYTGRVLGATRAYGSNHYHGYCSISIGLVDPGAGPKTAAGEALWLFIGNLFERFDFRKLYGDMTSSSFERIRSGGASMFSVEGRLKEHVKVGASYEDKIIIAISRAEWRELMDSVDGLAGSRIVD